MKKSNFYLSIFLALFIFNSSNISAEGELVPRKKTKEAMTTSTVSIDDLFLKNQSITDLGNIANVSSYNLKSNDRDGGKENYQDIRIRNTYMLRDNQGFTYGLGYSRSSFLPKNDLDNSNRISDVTIGYLYGNTINSDLAYYGFFNVTAGLGKDKFIQYSDGEPEKFETKFNALGFELGAGAIYRPFDNRNLLLKAQGDYDRTTEYYDNYRDINSQFCIGLNTAVKTSCDDYFCKRENYDGFTLPESTLNRHS